MPETMYRHTQVGWVIIICLSAGVVLVAALMAWYGCHWPCRIIFAALLVSLALMHSLTVELRGGFVKVAYGAGIIRKRIPLAEIQSCRTIRFPWYFGWGFRWIPRGWLFRVSGLAVVELRMRNGRRYGIGSDEPEELENAIKAACGII